MQPDILYVTEGGIRCGDCASGDALGGQSSDGITVCGKCGRPGHRGSLLEVHGKYRLTTDKAELETMYRGLAAEGRLWFTGIGDTPGMEFMLLPEEVIEVAAA
jgi:hypothetical protein